jgi:hypothetical protein
MLQRGKKVTHIVIAININQVAFDPLRVAKLIADNTDDAL